MAVSGVGQTNTNISDYTKGVNPDLGNSDLGVDDFLTLLTAQLQNQNMMEPTSDTEFIAQMAQFTTLQQIKEMSSMFQMNQAISMVGKEVFIRTVDDSGNTSFISGKVDSVNFENKNPILLVNGKYYDLSSVTDVIRDKTAGDESTEI